MMEHCQLLLGYLAGFLLKVKKHGGMYIGFDSKKKKMVWGYVDIRDKNV